jgi:hypothetical protein
MRNDIVNTLAQVLWEESKALAAVRASGFEPGRIPPFRGGATVFWSAVVDAVTNGARPGLPALLDAVHRATESPAVRAIMQGADERVELIARAMGRLFTGATESEQLARSAGFPSGEVPAFHTPATFWTAIVTATCQGAASIERLLHVARQRWPYNAEIADLHESVQRSPIRPAGLGPRLTVDEAIARVGAHGAKDVAATRLQDAIAEARSALEVGDIERARRALK